MDCTVSFNVSEREAETILKIARRAHVLSVSAGQEVKAYILAMDITAAHANGNPLALRELLEADDFNLAHDVFGIRRHIDRDTGALRDEFRPRFSKREG